MDSHCLECNSLCNTIIELKDGPDFHCCPKCALKIYRFKKRCRKAPPQSRKVMFKQKLCVKIQEKGIGGVSDDIN
jgi:predicted RNA-binding Zn-ribbon protein involved in translation (DUF1610 family)